VGTRPQHAGPAVLRARIVLMATLARRISRSRVAWAPVGRPSAVAEPLPRQRAGRHRKDAPGVDVRAATPKVEARIVEATTRRGRACDALDDSDAGGRAWSVSHGATGVEGVRPDAAAPAQFQGLEDPRFLEKLEDVVGLYLNPPEHALC